MRTYATPAKRIASTTKPTPTPTIAPSGPVPPSLLASSATVVVFEGLAEVAAIAVVLGTPMLPGVRASVAAAVATKVFIGAVEASTVVGTAVTLGATATVVAVAVAVAVVVATSPGIWVGVDLTFASEVAALSSMVDAVPAGDVAVGDIVARVAADVVVDVVGGQCSSDGVGAGKTGGAVGVGAGVSFSCVGGGGTHSRVVPKSAIVTLREVESNHF